jgi:hypothetical protein
MSELKLFGNLFLSIGAMKAGTTWLYAVLARHPQLHFTPEKEIHYFYHRFLNNKQLSDSARLESARTRYLLRFDPAKSNIHRIRENLRWVSSYLDSPVDDFWYRNLFMLRPGQTYSCDFSNLNAHLPAEIWPRIHQRCDKLRVLYTMRDPVKRLWSHTKFHLQITDQLDKLDSWTPKQFEKFARLPHIWDNAEYGAVLRRLRQGLPEDSYKAIFYEEMHSDQTGMLRQIEDFLGIRHHAYPEQVMSRRFTESVKRDMPEFFPELFANDTARIRAEIEAEGYALPAAWG